MEHAGSTMTVTATGDLDSIPLVVFTMLDSEAIGSDSLQDAVGDQFLCAANPIFRCIRRLARREGYEFSSADTGLWREYMAAPFLALNEILEMKCVPYVDNRSSLARIAARYPNANVQLRFALSTLKRNVTLHESSHCIAYSLLRRYPLLLDQFETFRGSREVIESLLGEAYANMVEKLGASAVDSGDHLLCYCLNSYVTISTEGRKWLDLLGNNLSRSKQAAIGMWSFFLSLLFDPSDASDKIFQRVITRYNIPSNIANQITEKRDKAGFTLHPKFRDSTTVSYFGVLGLADDYLCCTPDVLGADAAIDDIDKVISTLAASLDEDSKHGSD